MSSDSESSSSSSESDDERSRVDITESDRSKRAREGALRAAPLSSHATDSLIDLVESDAETEQPKKRVRSTTAMYAKYFNIVPTKGGNYKAICQIDGCGKSGFNSKFPKEHMPSHFGSSRWGSGLIDDYKKLFPREQMTIQMSIKKYCPDVAEEHMVEKPTKRGFNEVLARYIVGNALPFSTVDKPSFFEMLDYVYRMGQHDVKMDLMGTTTFTEKVLPSFLSVHVSEALAKHRNKAQIGCSLHFDSVTGKGGTTITNWMVTTGHACSLVASTRTGSDRSTSERLADIATCLINRRELISGMDDAILDDRFVAKAGDSQVIDAELKPLLSLCSEVWAAGSDSASNGQGALNMLRDRLGIVPFACVVHAFSNLAQELGTLMHVEVVEPVIKIINFFRSYGVFKALLQEQSKRVLIRLCATRFLTLFLALGRLIAVQKSIYDVVRSAKFEELVDEAAKAVRDEAEVVSALVTCKSFWAKVKFAHEMLACVVRAARFFDTSSQFAAVHVYTWWSALPESFKMVMSKHPELMQTNKSFYESVADLLVDRWERFDKPVYSAAFVLTPYNHARLQRMKDEDADGFARVMKETLDVCVQIYRRWSPSEPSARDDSMPDDHDLVMRMREILRAELEDFADGRGHWYDIDVTKFERVEPFRFWSHRAPKESPLCFYALKVTSLDPVTSRVERMHKRFAANRVKTRTRLRFSVNQSLAFLGDSLQSEKKTIMSWDEQLKKVDAFMTVTDDDEERLDKLVAQWIEEEDKDEAEENAAADADETAAPPSQAAAAQTTNAAASDASAVPLSCAPVAPPPAPPPPPAPLAPRVTRSGRKIKEKWFGDMFGKFDEDGTM